MNRKAPPVDRGVYRDPNEGLVRRREALLAQRRAASEAISQAARDAYVARFARVCAGVAATVGVVVLGVAALVGMTGVSALLVQQLVMAPAVYWIAAHFGRVRLIAALEQPLCRTHDPLADIARLEAFEPHLVLRRMADSLEYKSLVFPLTGLVVLLPLTVHLVVAQGIGLFLDARMSRLEAFDGWIGMSFATLGQCFLVVVWKARRYARQLRETSTSSLPVMGQMADSAPWEAIGLAGAAAVASGAIWVLFGGAKATMILIPALSAFGVGIVFLTGIAVVPPLYQWAHRRILLERTALGT